MKRFNAQLGNVNKNWRVTTEQDVGGDHMLHSEPRASTDWNSIKFSAAAVAVAVLAGCAVELPLSVGTPAKAPSGLEVACAADRKCPNGTAEYRATSSRSHSATSGKVTTAFAAPANTKAQRFTTASATPPNTEVQKVDLSAMTCRQFQQTSEGNVQVILAWFVGFYSEVEDPQVIDLGNLGRVRGKILAFCKEAPDFRMTTAAEAILGKSGQRPGAEDRRLRHDAPTTPASQ
jgi:acid stress chaperone HdeB